MKLFDTPAKRISFSIMFGAIGTPIMYHFVPEIMPMIFCYGMVAGLCSARMLI